MQTTESLSKISDLRIRTYPNPILRKNALHIPHIGISERNLLDDMAALMRRIGGIGLAAPQIGIDKALIVIDVGDGLMKFINPTIVQKTGREVAAEGCLSVPDVTINVSRARSVVVDYVNEHGTPATMHTDGILARALQHEIDHLHGKLIVDYAPLIKMLIAIKCTQPLKKVRYFLTKTW